MLLLITLGVALQLAAPSDCNADNVVNVVDIQRAAREGVERVDQVIRGILNPAPEPPLNIAGYVAWDCRVEFTSPGCWSHQVCVPASSYEDWEEWPKVDHASLPVLPAKISAATKGMR
jgi:hypothetical protein